MGNPTKSRHSSQIKRNIYSPYCLLEVIETCPSLSTTAAALVLHHHSPYFYKSVMPWAKAASLYRIYVQPGLKPSNAARCLADNSEYIFKDVDAPFLLFGAGSGLSAAKYRLIALLGLRLQMETRFRTAVAE